MGEPVPSHPRAVVVDDDPTQRLLLSGFLTAAGYRVTTFADAESCEASLSTLLPDVFLLDIQLPGASGLTLLDQCRSAHPDVPAVMLTSKEDADTIMEAMARGAFEYLLKPTDRQRLLTTVGNAVERGRTSRRLAELESNTGAGGAGFGIIGASGVMQRLFATMHRVAGTDVSVLVRGESGTGKELVARALHGMGVRAHGPFVAVNCAAVPEGLQESEFFGHERGAFTGAGARRVGRFEQADGGTLFLDEGGELSQAAQARLLRVLQERSFYRLGGDDEVTSDFRLIVATHRDLRAQVGAGTFREDLFYRVAVFEIEVPPLRDRGNDVILLAGHFAARLGTRIRGEPCLLTPEASAVLRAHWWPGNVRELQNVVQRALVAASGREIGVADLPRELRTGASPEPDGGARGEVRVGGQDPAAEDAAWVDLTQGMTLREIEQRAIRAALARNGGNRSQAARALGIARATLYRKLN
ncbi:MAG: sigma-54 dependent transcriptional regulator [Longimicrobiales bacterium]